MLDSRMGRPRKFTQEQVVRDAMGVFWDRGFRGASVSRLVEATGVQPGSLYGAFGDKQGLFEACLASYMEDCNGRVAATFQHTSSPLEGIRSYMERQIGLACGLEAHQGCLMARTTLEMPAEASPVTEAIQRNFAGLAALLTEAVRAAQADGELSRRWPSEKVASALLALVEGFQVLGRTVSPDVLRASYQLILEALN
jgi:TetR/AcrR family transcriptional regulator, transcriptional repressor for nem operon